MKKRVINKALCVALASALIFGVAAPAMAATDGKDQSQAAVAADTQQAAVVYYFGADGNASESEVNSSYVNISGNGKGESAELYINGVLEYTTEVDSYGNWDFSRKFYGKAGVTYTIELVVTGSGGTKITKTVKRKFAAYGFATDGYSANVHSKTENNGYSKYYEIYVSARFKNYVGSSYEYEVYRSTNPKSGFKKISVNKTSAGLSCTYYDNSAALGRTYYYRFKVIASKDSYIKEDKAITISPVIKAEADYGAYWTQLSLELGSRGVDITVNGTGMYNQFDIYRSEKASGGYKKIRTTTSQTYTDTTVKAGKTYYYKVIPKYYDPNTNKLYSGPAISSDNNSVKVLMGNPYLDLDKLSSTSVKLSWEKVRGANVYEIWYMQTDVNGNRYTRLAVTKGSSYTVKGLSAGHSYRFILKAQNVSGGKVLCENTHSESVEMAYDGYIYNLRKTSIQTAMSDDKKTYVIYTSVAWDKVLGASGYVITAHNNFTDREETIAKYTSWTRNTCRFRNPGSRDKGMKYSYITIKPYKGSVVSRKYVSCDVNEIPPASGVKVARKTNATAVVSWKAVPGAMSYTIYRKNLQSGVQQWIANTNRTSYEDKDYSVKTKYLYFIQPRVGFIGTSESYFGNYESDKRYTFTYEHKLGAPKMARARNTGTRTVTVSWSSVSGAQAYYVYRATSKDGKYALIGAVKESSYVDKKAARGQTYYYKATAVATGGNGVKAQSAFPAAVGVKCTK